MKKALSLLAVMVLFMPLAQSQSDAPEDTVELQANNNPTATIHTSLGDIRIELFEKAAPITVANFIQYANDDFYTGTIFHRVISHFVIQGGGMTADMQPKVTRDPIINEADNGLKNERGTIAMARTEDVHSATSQFFVNVEVNGA